MILSGCFLHIFFHAISLDKEHKFCLQSSGFAIFFSIIAASPILHGETLKAIPLKSGAREGYCLSLPLFNTILGVLGNLM